MNSQLAKIIEPYRQARRRQASALIPIVAPGRLQGGIWKTPLRFAAGAGNYWFCSADSTILRLPLTVVIYWGWFREIGAGRTVDTVIDAAKLLPVKVSAVDSPILSDGWDDMGHRRTCSGVIHIQLRHAQLRIEGCNRKTRDECRSAPTRGDSAGLARHRNRRNAI
jgi:hypothetical protein